MTLMASLHSPCSCPLSGSRSDEGDLDMPPCYRNSRSVDGCYGAEPTGQPVRTILPSHATQ